jgi:hypothetical protein
MRAMSSRVPRSLFPAVAASMVAVAGFAVAPGGAEASVSIAVSWDELLQASAEAVIATPIDARSVWEAGRIYTYSHVRVDRAIAGPLPPGGEAWVRTMGGIVGDTGQRVEGEPLLGLGQASLLFLQPGPNGSFHVTARAQGQFPVVAASDQRPAYVVRSEAVGALVPRQSPSSSSPALLAREALHGRSVDDAVHEIVSAWSRTHGR